MTYLKRVCLRHHLVPQNANVRLCLFGLPADPVPVLVGTNFTDGTNSAPCHGTISGLYTRLRSRIS